MNEQNTGAPTQAPDDFPKATVDGPAGADWSEPPAINPKQFDPVEALIQQRGKTAPRVKPSDIVANIASEYYFTAADGVRGHDITTMEPSPPTHESLYLLTICVLVLRNGFTVVGLSACASPENFDPLIGKVAARDDAIKKMWPLMGYALREQLYQAERDAALAEEFFGRDGDPMPGSGPTL